MTHATGAGVTALFPHRLNRWYGLPAQGVAVDDWAADNFDHADLDFIGGGNLWVYSDRRPIAAARMPTFGRAPRWGSAWKAFVADNADCWTNCYIQKSTLPYEDNYLDLHPTVTDPLGDPVCRITADFKDNERRIATFVQDRMVEWFRAAGAVEIVRQGLGTMGPSTHAYGGTRMGDDPETNVVDRWGFSHEVPNLGILGASVMGTSGIPQPDADGPGAGMAHRRAPGGELVFDLRVEGARSGATGRALTAVRPFSSRPSPPTFSGGGGGSPRARRPACPCGSWPPACGRISGSSRGCRRS